MAWAINRARLAVASVGRRLDRTRFVRRTHSSGECGDSGTAAQADKYRLRQKRSWEGLRTGDGRGMQRLVESEEGGGDGSARHSEACESTFTNTRTV